MMRALPLVTKTLKMMNSLFAPETIADCMPSLAETAAADGVSSLCFDQDDRIY
jgi:hypothetical protein